MKTAGPRASSQDRATTPRNAPVTGVALWSARHPWVAIAIWAVVIVATAALGSLVTTRMAGEIDLLTGQARQEAVMAQDAGHDSRASELILVQRRDGAALSTSTDGPAVKALAAQVRKTAHVAEVSAPAPSKDGRSALVTATIDGDPDTASERIGELQSAVGAFGAAHQGLSVRTTGDATISADFQDWLGADLTRATIISLPITLVMLLIVFGAWLVAGLPLLVGIASVASAVGLWAVASNVVPDQGLVSHVILLIGLAVGVDYSLFYVRRYREEYGDGHDRMESTKIAAATAGHSVLVSGLAVCLSMAGLLLVQDTLSTGAAVGAILVVLIAMLSSLTVLPAMLVLLRGAIDRPRVPVFWRLSRASNSGRAVRTVLRPVMRHPWAALAAMVVLFVALALPAASMNLKMTTTDDYPRSLQSMAVLDDVQAAFPGNKASVEVALQGEPAAVTGAVDKVKSAVTADTTDYAGVDDVWLSKDKRTALVTAAVSHEPASAEAQQAVRHMRNDILPGVGSVTRAVGGDVAANLDYTSNLSAKIPWVVGIVITMTFLFMLVAYRSLAIAVITITLNLASTLAAFGVVVLIFQGTWAEGILGFTSTRHVVSWIPLMLFVILSGLSLDYHVLVVNRIQEFARDGLDGASAVREGVARTAGVITSAAVIMIAVFCVFGGLSFIEMKQMGVGLAFAVLLDATVVRLVFLPALMMVCRRFLWWPGGARLGRRHSSAAGEATEATETTEATGSAAVVPEAGTSQDRVSV